MHKDRLEILATFLEGLPARLAKDQKFDMLKWHTDFTANEEDTQPTCGTAACAIGWAAHFEVFPELKLSGRARLRGRMRLSARPIFLIDMWGNPTNGNGYISEFTGIQVFFGLGFEDARWLFGGSINTPSKGVTPGMVARQIREFIRENDNAVNVPEPVQDVGAQDTSKVDDPHA